MQKPAATLPLPPRLVAEGVLRYQPNGNQSVYFPVTVHGQAATLVLGFGIDGGLILSTSTIATLPDATHLDSLTFGTVVERQLPIEPGSGNFSRMGQADLPPVIGVIGNTFLTRYDIVVDGPALRVQLYARPSGTSSRSQGLSPYRLFREVKTADCTPIVPMPEDNEGFVLHADGHPLTAIFETMATYTKMNVVAGRAVGLTQHSPQIHSVPDDIWEKQDAYGHPIKWQARGVHLTLGTQHFTDGPILIFPGLDVDRYRTPIPPVILVNLNNLRYQLLLISNSTSQVCLGEPR